MTPRSVTAPFRLVGTSASPSVSPVILPPGALVDMGRGRVPVHDAFQRPPQPASQRLGPRLSRTTGVLTPCAPAAGAPVTAQGRLQHDQPPPERLVRRPPDRTVTRHTLAAAPATPLAGTDDTARAVGFEPPPRDLRTRLIKPTKRGRVRAGEGNVRHVEAPGWTASELPPSGELNLYTGNDAPPARHPSPAALPDPRTGNDAPAPATPSTAKSRERFTGMRFLLRRRREQVGRAVREIVERCRDRWNPSIDVSASGRSALLSASETMRLLRSLDDPDPRYTEVPAGFRRRTEHKRFNLLAEAIDEEFSCSCTYDDRMQDTAELGRIEIPETVLDSPARIVISISNFGRMTIVALENPAAWSDAETAELMSASDRTRIEDALGRLGYIHISEDPLDDPYDGEFGWPSTWRDRFFEYI